MIRFTGDKVDIRDSEQVCAYLEGRVEAMRREIADLELENEKLRFQLFATGYAEPDRRHAASA